MAPLVQRVRFGDVVADGVHDCCDDWSHPIRLGRSDCVDNVQALDDPFDNIP